MAAVVFSADTDDSGLGLDGTVRNNAWKQAMATAINAAIGDWTAVTFNAGNFTASTGSWTLASGDVLVNRYQIINKTLIWNFAAQTTTVSATPLSLRIAIPSGTFFTTVNYNPVAFLSDNGTVRQGHLTPIDGTHLGVFISAGSNFAAATDATSVFFTASFGLS